MEEEMNAASICARNFSLLSLRDTAASFLNSSARATPALCEAEFRTRTVAVTAPDDINRRPR